ncbi:MAG TPA: gamma-glutamyl-gamma-aminobutyrate hydrolase family protein [Ktedonobacteraceae bacterium]|nr:gamma-glutamyl-gamma-aminobutyrate hydrolase family protein [Ktedonobacteraceae bacterium]
MRPLIGIPCYAGIHEGTHRPIYGNNRAYTQAVEAAGGVAVLIPLVHDVTILDVLIDRLDGILFPGGKDIAPSCYGEQPHPLLGAVDPQQDEVELALARRVIERDMPTLGICRGMQLLNVALGGSLYQDIGAQVRDSLKHCHDDQPRSQLIHNIQIEPGSRMEHILGTCEVWTNSLHHQSVKQPGKGVIISGKAEDGVAELLEVRDHYFMVAVQGHPEEIYTRETVWSRVFSAFISACEAGAMRKTKSIIIGSQMVA